MGDREMGDRDRLNGAVCASIVALWRDRRVEIGELSWLCQDQRVLWVGFSC